MLVNDAETSLPLFLTVQASILSGTQRCKPFNVFMVNFMESTSIVPDPESANIVWDYVVISLNQDGPSMSSPTKNYRVLLS